MKQTPHAEHGTSDGGFSQRDSAFNVGRRALDVRRLLWATLSIAIGALFIYAGALKAWNPARFASDIENYHLVPWPIGVGMAFYLPWLEMFCGLALILRRLCAGAVFILLGLMVIFIGATAAAKVRGIDITCGCFGRVSDQMSFAWHLVLDLAILGALVALGLRHASARANFSDT